MALPGTSWHYRTEPSFPNSEPTPVGYRIPGTASEAGGRAFAAKRSFASARQRSCPANRARVTIWFRALSGLAPASVAHRITEPDRTISLYRFFGMVQISSGGFLPLLIWTRNFRLGQGGKHTPPSFGEGGRPDALGGFLPKPVLSPSLLRVRAISRASSDVIRPVFFQERSPRFVSL
jgi:hypothetical protein